MAAADNKERELSREFRKTWKSWATFFEPAFGSDFGIPDVEVFVFKRCVHVELKIAEIVLDGKGGSLLKSKNVRPAQIAWHSEASMFGVPCLFLFGIETNSGWLMYAGTIDAVKNWKRGLRPGQDVELIGGMQDLNKGLSSYIIDKVLKL